MSFEESGQIMIAGVPCPFQNAGPFGGPMHISGSIDG